MWRTCATDDLSRDLRSTTSTRLWRLSHRVTHHVTPQSTPTSIPMTQNVGILWISNAHTFSCKIHHFNTKFIIFNTKFIVVNTKTHRRDE